MIIENGADGAKVGAKVDDHHRLYVVSNNVHHEQHHATYHKNLFYVSFSTTLADGTETPVAFVKNTESGTDIELDSILMSSDANVKFGGYFQGTYTSGGATTTATNTNVGTPIVLGADLYEGGASADLTLGTTNAEHLGNTFVGAISGEIRVPDAERAVGDCT